MGYGFAPRGATVGDIAEEVVHARTKFPSNAFLLAALMEEVGELAQAMLQKQPRERIYAEAKGVACVAIRIMEEGDSTFDALTDEQSNGVAVE